MTTEELVVRRESGLLATSNPYNEIFKGCEIVAGKDSCSSNFAAGKMTIGKDLSDSSLFSLQKMLEDCDRP